MADIKYFQEPIDNFIEGIEKYWSGRFGPYKVKTMVNTSFNGSKALINTVNLKNGRGRSHVINYQTVNFFVIPGYTQNPSTKQITRDDPRRVAAHEAGHLMFLRDRYDDDGNGYSIPHKGWEKNIMGDAHNGKVEKRNIEEILKENKCQCK